MPHSPDDDNHEGQATSDAQTAVREILALLPADVLKDLNRGTLDPHDSAFLDGLTDHVSRLSLADPRQGRRILGKIIRLKKLIAQDLRRSDPDVVVSQTVTRSEQRVGRNGPCPCGSGKKFKHCCLHKH